MDKIIYYQAFCRILAILALVLICHTSNQAVAHPGGLNSEGCHNNRKTGEYHCHRAPTNSYIAPSNKSNSLADKSNLNLIRETGFSCSDKATCKQMTSCAEAKYYLNTCGMFKLDGNGDGVPCESICK